MGEPPLLAHVHEAPKFPRDRRPRCQASSRLEAMPGRGRSLLPGRLRSFPGLPGAFPVFFCGPGFRLEKMKVERATYELGEMPRRHERVIGFPFAHLLPVELISNSVVIRIFMKLRLELVDRSAGSGLW